MKLATAMNIRFCPRCGVAHCALYDEGNVALCEISFDATELDDVISSMQEVRRCMGDGLAGIVPEGSA